jgi:hypothetical protein
MELKMTLRARLEINNHLITSIPLRHCKGDRAKNQATARRWLQGLYVDHGDTVQVLFMNNGEVVENLELIPDMRDDKLIFTQHIDKGERYFWGTLTSGYPGTWAITAGCLFRKPHPTPPVEMQGKLFPEGARVWF